MLVMFRKGTNLTRKGKYSSTLPEPLRIWARASSYHYSLGRLHFFWFLILVSPKLINVKVRTVYVLLKQDCIKTWIVSSFKCER